MPEDPSPVPIPIDGSIIVFDPKEALSHGRTPVLWVTGRAMRVRAYLDNLPRFILYMGSPNTRIYVDAVILDENPDAAQELVRRARAEGRMVVVGQLGEDSDLTGLREFAYATLSFS